MEKANGRVEKDKQMSSWARIYFKQVKKDAQKNRMFSIANDREK